METENGEQEKADGEQEKDNAGQEKSEANKKDEEAHEEPMQTTDEVQNLTEVQTPTDKQNASEAAVEGKQRVNGNMEISVEIKQEDKRKLQYLYSREIWKYQKGVYLGSKMGQKVCDRLSVCNFFL